MIKVKLIGAGGYGGIGMVELLAGHPQAELVGLVDVQGAGEPLSAMWPYLRGYCDMVVLAADSDEARDLDADVTICATPDGVGQAVAPVELAAGRKVIDYSGDFRFSSAALYGEYATRIGREPSHGAAALLPEAVYGLTELHREELGRARLVGNPGCFAMGCIVGLWPAVAEGLVLADGIVCDCKTGVSGAGKKPSAAFHFPERYEQANAYRLTGHQHVMEIEHQLGELAGHPVAVTFTPQVIPMARGILSTLYGRLPDGVTNADVLDAYQARFASEPFFEVRDLTEAAGTADVRGTNRVVLTVACDERTGTFRTISHIDNLVKGQAGSAVQNLNLLCGLPETLGLDMPPRHP